MPDNRLETMTLIQEEKAREIGSAQQPELDAETKKLAEHKRFTFDVIETPSDPLR